MRKKKTRRQKNEEFRRRYDAIKNLMSTFAMSTVAVVAAVTLIPASPKAEILKVDALSEEVVYQVNVTDEDNALVLESLVVVLENQLEYHEEKITLGENSGFFENLETDTRYRLSVYGDKGFGNERLDTIFVTTRAKVGATILSVNPVEGGHHGSNYDVDVSVFDPDELYTSITLYYGYTWEPEEEIMYNSIPITTDRQLIELMDIMTSYPFHIYLEGTTTEGTELLDEIWVTPPFELFASAYLAYYNNHQYAFHMYGDSYIEDLEFKVNVHLGTRIVQTVYFTPSSDHHDHNKLLIENLTPDTTYVFEFIAVFTNPNTLRTEEQLVLEEAYKTAEDYSYTYTRTTVGELEEVTFTIDDPNDVIGYVYLDVMYIVDGIENFQIDTYFLEVIDEQEQTTFSFMIPVADEYEIFIGIRNNTDFNINEILEELVKD